MATKSLPLDFFVMFSSIASLLGNIAQSSYSAANLFMDSFASYRRSLGLPANTINWGVIADVGYGSLPVPLLSLLLFLYFIYFFYYLFIDFNMYFRFIARNLDYFSEMLDAKGILRYFISKKRSYLAIINFLFKCAPVRGFPGLAAYPDRKGC